MIYSRTTRSQLHRQKAERIWNPEDLLKGVLP